MEDPKKYGGPDTMGLPGELQGLCDFTEGFGGEEWDHEPTMGRGDEEVRGRSLVQIGSSC